MIWILVHAGRGCTECSEEDQVMACSFHPDIEASNVQDRQLVMKRISSLSSAGHADHVLLVCRLSYKELCCQVPEAKSQQCLCKTLEVLFDLMCSYYTMMTCHQHPEVKTLSLNCFTLFCKDPYCPNPSIGIHKLDYSSGAGLVVARKSF